MPIPYYVKLNNGNENIGAEEKTITVNEVVTTAYASDMAREIHQLNPLIPEQVTMSVLENFCQAAANIMAMGHAVVLQSKGKAAIRIYPDIKLYGRNITLSRAQQLDPTIAELTTENAGELVQRVGVRVRARAECEPAMSKLLTAAGVSTQKKDVVNVPKVLRPSNNGGNNGGTTPSGGGNDPNGGND